MAERAGFGGKGGYRRWFVGVDISDDTLYAFTPRTRRSEQLWRLVSARVWSKGVVICLCWLRTELEVSR